MIKSEICNALK